ncbi:MAG: SH3 domain-containing protein [Pseudomonadota bacterium]
MRLIQFLKTLTISSLLAFPGHAFAQTTGSINVGKYSNLPLPRFVSLKAERVNMRVGPGKAYAVVWRFEKAGLPLEVIQEFDNWRRVRDVTGDTGWIHKSLLTGRRAGIATPWRAMANNNGSNASQGSVGLYDKPAREATRIALLKPGVIGRLPSCDGIWCEMEVEAPNGRTIKGYVSQTDLWGAYPDEEFD